MKPRKSKAQRMKRILVLFLLTLVEIKGNSKYMNFGHARNDLTSKNRQDNVEKKLQKIRECCLPFKIIRGGSISTGDANEQTNSSISQKSQPEMRQDMFIGPDDIHATKRDGSKQLMDRNKV